ncbi:MAG TPA: MOSC domain-containing protein [Woeseiaceae bacterium]|nr:MOSC domain-containing protein [Woeseiaceae bacterium]
MSAGNGMRLSELWRYPIKSTAGEALERAQVGFLGIDHDRRYMVARPDGRFLTARQYPGLQRVVARPIAGGLRITHPERGEIVAREAEFTAEPLDTAVWGDEFAALTTTAALDEWFSGVLGTDVRLLWLGHETKRFRAKVGRALSFADGYPLMLISQASLDDLNTRTDRVHRMSQFRPNLVVAGSEPFAEDGWSRIRIGKLELTVAKPCSRCVMVTVDPETGKFLPGREPLTTLGRYRRGADREVYFGQNLVPLADGELELGAPVEVLETRPPNPAL